MRDPHRRRKSYNFFIVIALQLDHPAIKLYWSKFKDQKAQKAQNSNSVTNLTKVPQ